MEDIEWYDGEETFERITPTGTKMTMTKVKIGNVIDVKNPPFSAAGDGSTDDTAAFLAAILAADGGSVYVPSGTYKLTTAFGTSITSDINLIGDGPTSSILDGNSTNTIRPYNGKKVRIQGIKFQNWTTVLTQQNTTDTITRLDFHHNEVNTANGGITLNCKVTYADISHNKFVNINQATTSAALAIRLGTNVYADQASSKKYIVSHNEFYDISTTANDECHAILLYGREAVVEGNIIDTLSNGDGNNCEGIYTKCLYANISGNVLINAGRLNGCITIKGSARGETSTPRGYCTKVIGNTLIESGIGSGIRGIAISCDDILVANNTIEGFDYGITTANGLELDNLAIIGNQILKPGLVGIGYDSYGVNTKIDDNMIFDPGAAYAVGVIAYGIVVTTDAAATKQLSISNNQIYVTSATQATTDVYGVDVYSNQANCTDLKMNGNLVYAGSGITPTVTGIVFANFDEKAYNNTTIIGNNLASCDTGINFIGGGFPSSWTEWRIEHNIGLDEVVTAASPTLQPWGYSSFDTTSNAIAGTLGSGQYIGQQKHMVLTTRPAGNNAVITVTAHAGGDGGTYTFDLIDEAVVLEWTGTEWIELKNQDATWAGP